MLIVNKLIHKFYSFIWLIVLVAGLVCIAGCASTSNSTGESTDNMPWNTPTDWEQNVFGVPY
ncbi:MAG: hypothetical protein ACOCQP_02305 [Lentisphaeria bacterium]